jgi:hypothetical protein
MLTNIPVKCNVYPLLHGCARKKNHKNILQGHLGAHLIYINSSSSTGETYKEVEKGNFLKFES